MSGLSDADRNLIRTKAYLATNLGLDPLLIAVEAIATRAVNEALTEAADAIEGWRLNAVRAGEGTTDPGAQVRSRVRALTYARAEGIVRSRTTSTTTRSIP